jgi:hypothetical protein
MHAHEESPTILFNGSEDAKRTVALAVKCPVMTHSVTGR